MTSAILVAAGSSQRMGFDKLSALLAGRSVLEHSLYAFDTCPAVDEIILVTSPEREEAVRTMGIEKLVAIVPGGAARHLSVSAGLEACSPLSEIVAVHDGARPLVTPQAISRLIETVRTEGAASLAHPISDTLKRVTVEDGSLPRVSDSVSRDHLWAMETPQAMRRNLLIEAYAHVLKSGSVVTDEVSAIEALGQPVSLVENDEPNPKITFPGDLALAETLLAAREGESQG